MLRSSVKRNGYRRLMVVLVMVVSTGCGGSERASGGSAAGGIAGEPGNTGSGTGSATGGVTGSDASGSSGTAPMDTDGGVGSMGGAQGSPGGAGGHAGSGGINTAGQSSGGAAGATGGSSNVGGEAGAAGEAGAGGTAGTELWRMPNNEPGLPNQASYEVTSDVVIDNVTTLMWEAMPSLASYSSAGQEISQHCGTLVLGGFDDWRLPDLMELVSLLDRTQDHPALPPAIAGQFDPDDTNNTYAFGTSSLDSNGFQWTVRLEFGNTRNEDVSRAWCVRGRTDSPPGTYQLNGDGTTLDERTGFLWQTVQSPTEVSQVQARTACENLSLGGSDDWRLPSEKELFTLFQEGLVSPRLDLEAFPGSTRGPFWASMDDKQLDFALGPATRTDDATFRCVR